MSDGCPNRLNHTWTPDGYIQFMGFCERNKKQHKQTRCPACLKWSIWVPKISGVDKLPTVGDVEEMDDE